MLQAGEAGGAEGSREPQDERGTQAISQLPLSPLGREQRVLSSHNHRLSAGYYSSI